MKQLKLEFTEAGPLYKCEEGIYYQFNSSGDLVYLSQDDGTRVWDYAIGSFKINDAKDVYQTQEYYDKYYKCSKKEPDITDWKEQEIEKVRTAMSLISVDDMISLKGNTNLHLQRYEFFINTLDKLKNL